MGSVGVAAGRRAAGRDRSDRPGRRGGRGGRAGAPAPGRPWRARSGPGVVDPGASAARSSRSRRRGHCSRAAGGRRWRPPRRRHGRHGGREAARPPPARRRARTRRRARPAGRGHGRAGGRAGGCGARAGFGAREVVDGSDAGASPRCPASRCARPGAAATVLLSPRAEVPPASRPPLDAVRRRPDHGCGTATLGSTRRLRRPACRRRAPVLGVGPGLGPADGSPGGCAPCGTRSELPGGGLLPFPGRRMVALYGHPGTAALGMLGEQSADPRRSRGPRMLAAEYAALTETPVVPAFELIATVARVRRGRRLLLAPHTGRAAPAVGRGGRGRRGLRRARPAARPHRLPRAGQARTRSCCGARGSGWPSTRSGGCARTRCTCGRSARSGSTRSTGWALARRARARARPAAQGADPAPVPPVDDPRPGAARHLARRGAVARARRRPGRPGRQAGDVERRCGATCPTGSGSAGRTSRTRTSRCSRPRRRWRRCTPTPWFVSYQ